MPATTLTRIKSLSLATACAFALIAAPLSFAPVPSLFGVDQAYAANNGNGNGGGSSKPKKPKKAKPANSSNSGGSGNSANANSSSGNGNGNGGNANGSARPRNLHAELGGLNSLRRNINGLMNSADPRMNEIRIYVDNGAQLVVAEDALVAATTDFTNAQIAYDGLIQTLGLDSYADTSPTGLAGELALLQDQLALDPENPDLQAQVGDLQTAITIVNTSPELANLIGAGNVLDAAQSAVTGLEALTSDDALLAALQSAANPNRSVDGDSFDWAKLQLDRAIADYLAMQPAPEPAPDPAVN